MWFDNAIDWFQVHRGPLGGIVAFVAGVLGVFDTHFDHVALDVALSLAALTAAALLGSGFSNSDRYHKAKQAFLRTGADRRSTSLPAVGALVAPDWKSAHDLSEMMQDDLRPLLDALGLFSGARPQSPREVLQEATRHAKDLRSRLDEIHALLNGSP
jgi:hypothetical protein